MLVVVITGSSRGLGFALAKEFLKSEAHVVISGKNLINLEKAKASLAEYGSKLLAIPCDVGKREEVEQLWQEVIKEWGKVDFWINNAGINQKGHALWEISSKDTDQLIQTNLLGTIYGSQVAISGMLQQGSGQIFNMEGFGSDEMHRQGLNLYGTSKRALTYFTESLALEAGSTPVKVGLLSPGMMVTDFITEATPDEQSKRIFNILGDKPETVAKFLVPRILANQKNGAHLVWLTKRKALRRFVQSLVIKRKLFE